MKKLRLWAVTLLLASTLFLAITQQGKADSDRPSINANGMVRLVYFLPNDRPARPDRMAALRQLIKEAQQFYADEMHRHGFGEKTFTVESNAVGEPVVHQIDGRFTDNYYYTGTTDFKVWAELQDHFGDVDALQHVYFIAIDLSYEALNDGQSGGLGGVIFYPSQGDIGFGPAGKAKLRHRDITGEEEVLGGFALIPAFGHNFDRLGLTLHELGHGFGLVHDFRTGRDSDYIMGFGNATRLSKCAAEWLSVNRFFNTKSTFHNEPGEIRFLSLQTYNRDVINLRFKVTDPDGLHQAQLLVPDILKDPRWAGWGAYRLFDCKRLNGKTGTVESVVRTAEIVDRITLQIIDVGGNITWATFPLQLDEIEPAQNALDVNSDGVVDILDLVPFVSRFGQRGKDAADVNENGIIDIVDVLLVAAHIPDLSQQTIEMPTEADVQQWLTHAKQLEVENEILQKGIVLLEHLLAALTAVVVDIPDVNLRVKIEDALGKVSGATITTADMEERLTHLEARNANISNLTGLEAATNLKSLWLDGEEVRPGVWDNSNSVSDLSPLAGLTQLEGLDLWQNSVTDISALAGLTNLTHLGLVGNNISDVSVLIGFTNLESLWLDGNPISDFSPLAGLTKLRRLGLDSTSISDLSPLTGLTNLTWMRVGRNNITDLSPLVANTGLGNGDEIYIRGNPLSYLSIHTHIPALQSRGVTVEFDNRTPAIPLKISGDNQEGTPSTILDQSFAVDVQDQNGKAFAGVPVVFTVTEGGGVLSIRSTVTDANGRAESTLTLGPNLGTNTVAVSVEGIAQTVAFSAEAALPPPVPTTLSIVSGDNQSGLTGEALANPFVVEVRDQYDDPMEGVTVTFAVSAGGGTPSPEIITTDANGRAESTLTLGSNPGTNTVEVSVERITEMLTFNALAKLLEFDLSLPAGLSLIHVPLKVVAVDGVEKTIASVSDLYDALGGASKVTFLATYDSQTQQWVGYFGASDKDDESINRKLTDAMGILANMIVPTSVHLTGSPLGTNGTSTITLHPEFNVVGLPLRDSSINRVSDLLTLDGIKDNVHAIIFTDNGEFQLVTQPTDPGNIPIVGGQAFMLYAQRTETVTISGEGWTRISGTAAAPLVGDVDLHSPLTGIQVTDTTPVLGLQGLIVGEATGLNKGGFRVTVKNLSTGKAAVAVTSLDETDYRHIIVDIETKRAATVGDILEISARSADPFIGVEPLRYTVTAEDVKRSLIQLPALVAYEIPAETELLANYPNPFNPETWIPYRLAEDAFVTLTIYDLNGQIIRTLEVGHRIASTYESRSKAIHWDGKNGLGEQVASGVYFYTLTAGDFSATRRMVILEVGLAHVNYTTPTDAQ